MHLINRNRGIQLNFITALFHPGSISPCIISIPDYGGGPGRNLAIKSERVSFIRPKIIMMRDNVVFVNRTLAYILYKTFPDAGTPPLLQKVTATVPAVEIADNGDLPGVGRPDGKISPADTIDG